MTLMDYASELFRCTVDELYSRSRKREIVSARQVCMSAMRDFTSMTISEIGRHFGQSHCAVIHSISVVKDHYRVEKDFREVVDKIYDGLNRGDIVVFDKPGFVDYIDEQMALYADLV